MGLGKYIAKRHFTRTPEPSGRPGKLGKQAKTKSEVKNHSLKFVVQEHHASTLHYDFRLELDGVLKSWAVPKGPSMSPHDHHLAIQVEDHPYDYRTFEGAIPEGNYGAGNVIIWDAGTYEPRQETTDAEETLRAELAKGHLTFVLHGTKLQGEFALIKMPRAHEKNAWLLIKKDDEFATNAINITDQDTSVKSGKKVDEMGAIGTLPDISDYPAVATPWTVHPMLCTLIEEPFDKDGWIYEMKWDGYRAIGAHSKKGVQLYSRAGTSFMDKFSPVAEALHDMKHDVILDGEVVVIDDEGMPHFEWLQNWHREPQGHLQYCVFDILWCDGHDVRTMPLIERKKLLQAVVPRKSAIHYSHHVETKGVDLFKQIQHKGLEGIVAKRADSHYGEDERGQNWLKIKTHLRQEVVIGGFTEPRGSRTYLGALLVGIYVKGEFVYVGHSGGGIAENQRKALRTKLDKLERQSSPFTTIPKPNAPVHWVKPELVCEMNFSEWTSDGSMRQPKYVGLRVDKKPVDVHRERARSLAAIVTKRAGAATPKNPHITAPNLGGPQAKRHFEPTHLDKIFFPAHKYTKGDLVQYYESVADVMLPYLKDRALSLLRQPGGVNDHGFFQKNMPHAPDWLPTADIYSDSHSGNLHWMVGGTLEALLYAVQLGSIEINPWNSRITSLDKPDWAVIDLDPEGVTFKDVIKVAQTVKAVCAEWHIPSYPKTSGKTGIHIFIPMGAKYDYEQVKNMAHLLALEIHRRLPDLTSVERMPDKRPHRIYLDFLQNRQGQTLAAPYSVRPTPDATVATPLHWDEVTSSLKPTDFTIINTLDRLKRVGDLWKPVLGPGVNITAILEHIPTDPQK